MIHKKSKLLTQSMFIPRVMGTQNTMVLAILQLGPKSQIVHTSIRSHPLLHLEAELLVIKLWEKATTARRTTTQRGVKSMT